MKNDHSILGGWLGTYSYSSRYEMPVRFEATFSLPRGEGEGAGFVGTILDDSPLGEASVTHGQQTGLNMRFTKVYQSPPPGTSGAPIHYLGTLSEDGKTVKGRWEMQFNHHGKLKRMKGNWDARRLWQESEEEQVESTGRALSIQLLSR